MSEDKKTIFHKMINVSGLFFQLAVEKAILFCFIILLAQSAYGDTKFSPQDVCGVPDEYIVLINPIVIVDPKTIIFSEPASVANDLAVQYGGKVLRPLTIGNYHYFVMEIHEDNARALAEDVRVLYVEQDSYLVWLGFTCPVFSRPNEPQIFGYSAVATPLIPTLMAEDWMPSHAKPIGLGSVAEGGTLLTVRVLLPPFSRPVDRYLAMYAPSMEQSLWFLARDNTLRPASEGIAKWNENTTKAIDELLGTDIPVDTLPAGRYYFYLAVTPPGSTDVFYLWETYFDKQ